MNPDEYMEKYLNLPLMKEDSTISKKDFQTWKSYLYKLECKQQEIFKEKNIYLDKINDFIFPPDFGKEFAKFPQSQDELNSLATKKPINKKSPIKEKPIVTLNSELWEAVKKPSFAFTGDAVAIGNDASALANALAEAVNDPNTLAELKHMNPTEMTQWIAQKLGKPVVTATQKNGKVKMVEKPVLIATPEEIAAFEQDFMH